MKSSFLQKSLKVISAFALILFFANNMKAQVWCPPGASWHYNGDALMLSGYHELTYSGDSIVSSLNCQKILDRLEGHGFPSDINAIVDSFYTYSQSGVVYIYNNRYGLNRFDTLFNINANIGDKWRMPLADTACDSINVVVLDTGSTVINSLNLKWLNVKFKYSNASSSYVYDTIIERIGFVKTFFYFPMVCQYIDERSFDGLRCYSDNTFGSYSTGISSSCNYFYTGIYEQATLSQIELYPNPVSTELTVRLKTLNNKTVVVIRDILGVTIKEIDWKSQVNGSDEMRIKVDELLPGVYFLQMISGGTIQCKKFVKQ